MIDSQNADQDRSIVPPLQGSDPVVVLDTTIGFAPLVLHP
jgi:hypothetical protein